MKNEGFLFLAAFCMVTCTVVQAEVIGPTVERDGNTYTIYSAPVFWDNGYGWEKINESFYDCGKNGYCTQSYDFSAQSKDGEIILTKDQESISYKMTELVGYIPDFSQVKQADNFVYYVDVAPGIDVQHTFYADLLKEDIIINQQLKNPPPEYRVVFEKTGKNNFVIDPFIMCDAKEQCVKVDMVDEPDILTLNLDGKFLEDKNTVYPVKVDPSLRINDTNTTFTGYVTLNNLLPSLTRTIDPPAVVDIGRTTTFPSAGDTTARASFEFNISAVTPGSDISLFLLKVNVVRVGTEGSELIFTRNMENRNVTYPDDASGNLLYWDDMGNGTIFNVTNFSIPGIGEYIFDLNNIIPTVEASLSSGRDWIGFGFSITESFENSTLPGANRNSTRFSSRRAGTVNNRPYINVTFTEPVFHPPENITKIYRPEDSSRLWSMYLNEALLILLLLTATLAVVYMKRKR